MGNHVYLNRRSDKPEHSGIHELDEQKQKPMHLRVPPDNDPLPTREQLLEKNPNWTSNKETALKTGRPWLDPSLNLRDPKTGWLLPGTPRRFKPGKSGNPRGVTKTPSIVKSLEKLLKYNKHLQTALAVKLVKNALADDPQSLAAIKVALDRLDGPVKQDIDISARQIDEAITLVDRTHDTPLPLPKNGSEDHG